MPSVASQANKAQKFCALLASQVSGRVLDMASLLTDFMRVSRRHPCPVCRRPTWCLVTRSCPQNPTEAICARVVSPHKRGDAGWLHQIRGDYHAPQRPPAMPERPPAVRHDLATACKKWEFRMSPQKRQYLATQLGVSEDSLRRLGVGWATAEALREFDTGCQELGAYVFPMHNAARGVIGARLRAESGFKWAIKGSKQGVFYPIGLKFGRPMLFLAEGPTDCMALLDMGFCAIGRANCSAGGGLLREIVRNLRPASVIIVSDNDAPGLLGAAKIGEALLSRAAEVKIIRTPAGVKDVRQWKSVGAVAQDVQRLVSRAKPLQTPAIDF